VVVGIMLVRARRFRVVVVVIGMTLVNQPGGLKQRVRRSRQPEGHQQQRHD
jgi:hypothetical protein